jgi:PAS domain S-box-containing protein
MSQDSGQRFVVVFEERAQREEAVALLQGGFQEHEMVQVGNRAAWMECLKQDCPGLIIASVELSWESSLSLLATVKRQWTECPVLFCEERGGDLQVVAAMLGEKGDYLLDLLPQEAGLAQAVEAALLRAEQRRLLRQAQERYRSLFERVPVGLYRTNRAGDIVDGNPALVELLGFDDLEELKTHNVEDFFVDRGVRERELARLEEHGVAVGMEMQLRRKNGEQIWVQDSARALSVEGDAYFYEGALEDVTEAKAAQRRLQRLNEELSKERQRLAGVVENFPEGVLVLDRDRRVLLANPLARDYLDLLAKRNSIGSLVGLGDRALDTLLNPGGPTSRLEEVTLSHPTERVFEVLPRQVEGSIHGGGWILVIREVTAAREAAQRLEQQERMASLGQLAAGIAHDFGNIITVISTDARALMEKMDPADKSQASGAHLELLEQIIEESRKAGELVQYIQDFGNRTTDRHESTDLVLVLGQLRAFLRRTIPENIQLEMNLDCDECVVLGDLAVIQQMMATLALNARDSMEQGGVFRVRLRREKLEKTETLPVAGMAPGEWAVMEVSDTGRRPPKQFLPKIFDSFFGNQAASRGVGLALAQVYGIVRQHNGYMKVDHEEGLGTALKIYLPVAGSFKRDVAKVEPSGLPRGDGEMILVVDDEPSVVRSTVSALELLRYKPLAASCGKEALELYHKHKDALNLIMADVVMPDMGGEELLENIQQDNPEFSVVLMTGYAGKIRRDQIAAKTAGWLEKPWTLPELARTVRNALAPKKQ